jgi:hypothetical protein
MTTAPAMVEATSGTMSCRDASDTGPLLGGTSRRIALLIPGTSARKQTTGTTTTCNVHDTSVRPAVSSPSYVRKRCR